MAQSHSLGVGEEEQPPTKKARTQHFQQTRANNSHVFCGSTADLPCCRVDNVVMENNSNKNGNYLIEEDDRRSCSEAVGGPLSPPSVDEIRDFYLRDPITAVERSLVDKQLRANWDNILTNLEAKGAGNVFREYVEGKEARDEAERRRKLGRLREWDETAKFRGVPRSYQIKLLDRATQQNTIVHLGTGMGKTLIAILLIKRITGVAEMEHEPKKFTEKTTEIEEEKQQPAPNDNPPMIDSGKTVSTQVVFLVPSVALVLQHFTTLKANLPLSVETAFNSSMAKSQEARAQLAKAQVLVATHGAYLDLLQHYGDLFSLRRVKLLVIDECHNCIKNSTYALIMKQFYHTLKDLKDRPRVLGLTASPLINIRMDCSDAELGERLNELECTLDASVVPLQDLGFDIEMIPALLQKDAQEEIISFQSSNQRNAAQSFISRLEASNLNAKREKEFRQLGHVLKDLGPKVTKLLCQQLHEKLARNAYEDESEREFYRARQFLSKTTESCGVSKSDPYTAKLEALHILLDHQFTKNPDAVGLVFVQRRVTAMALNSHFRQLRREQGLEDDLPTTNVFRGGNNQRSIEVHDAQFEDASDEEEYEIRPAPIADLPVPVTSEKGREIEQFADADGDKALEQWGLQQAMEAEFFPINNAYRRNNEPPVRSGMALVKTAALVRKPSTLFRILHKQEGAGASASASRNQERQQMGDSGLLFNVMEEESSIRDTLSSLRRRDINVLVATSVVEEGLDVQACSFVVMFDQLTSLKNYIQMKGRARDKDASFFVFEEDSLSVPLSAINLSTVREAEERVNRFLATRASSNNDTLRLTDRTSRSTRVRPEGISPDELRALEDRQFKTSSGIVTVQGAKSLLCRYALMQPMDPAVRTSRGSLRAHLPSYDFEADVLSIPSNLGSYHDIRRGIRLPKMYCSRTKKERESLASLMTIVRLYKHGLLNERLLPLSDKDIQQRFIAASKKCSQQNSTVNVLKPPTPTVYENGLTRVFLHSIQLDGARLHNLMEQFNSKGRMLGILSFSPITADIPAYKYSLGQFGDVSCTFGSSRQVLCSSEQLEAATHFFELIWNSRWRRRTKSLSFRCLPVSETYFPYKIVCLDKDGNLDFDCMDQALEESKRTQAERIDVVNGTAKDERLFTPRLWTPRYDECSIYVLFGPSDDTCDEIFPFDHDNASIRTYKDYYKVRHNCDVSENCILFDAARLWQLPSRAWSEQHDEIKELKRVKLPQDACMEADGIADPGLFLLALLLPQCLYHIEQRVSLSKFLEHTQKNVPNLARYLSKITPPKLLRAITAKSCSDAENYERLEWLGDGVLKLVQTDCLINSNELGSWIRNLPEGYLNAARSWLGSNANLREACQKLKLDMFIQTESLSRGKWTPISMDLVDEENSTQHKKKASGKVTADVLESLLGLVFLEFGYQEAVVCTDALQLTIPHKFVEPSDLHQHQKVSASCAKLVEVMEAFTGYKLRNPLVAKEALTHSTDFTNGSKSYEKLEWVGDAVLCLAARAWIYRNCPQLELGDMVLLESALVCNETLAFLSQQCGLPAYMRHGDQSLPARIENYAWSTRELGRGLWGTDPPKCIADIVESLFGAAHVDGGFEAGQLAVHHALRSVFLAVKSATAAELQKYCYHPKRIILSELGCLASLATVTQDTLEQNIRIWADNKWVAPDSGSKSAVSILKCLGDPILAVSDPITSSSINRVSAFVLAFLTENSSVLSRVRDAKADIQRSFRRGGSDNELNDG